VSKAVQCRQLLQTPSVHGWGLHRAKEEDPFQQLKNSASCPQGRETGACGLAEGFLGCLRERDAKSHLCDREKCAISIMGSQCSGRQLGEDTEAAPSVRRFPNKRPSSLPQAPALEAAIWLRMKEIPPSRVPSWTESLKNMSIISLQRKRHIQGHSKIVFAETSVRVTK
jgi:hypothetical protein